MKRKILYALLSAAIAIGLWVYVVTVVSPESTETYHNIPVILDGENVLRDRSLMIVTEKIPQITLKLSGNRSDLRKLNSSNIRIVMDLSRITEAGTKDLPYTISYPGDVPSGSIQVMSQSPERITLDVVQADRTTVSVEVKSPNKVSAPYWVDSEKITQSQKTVTVEGPADVIAKITSAAVVVDVSGKTETIKEDFPVILYDENGNVIDDEWLTFDASAINVTVPIYMKKEVDLVLPNLIHGGGTNDQNTTLEGLPQKVTVYGNKQVIANLDKISVNDKIDLSAYNNGMTFDLDISKDLGMGVYLDESVPSTVTVTVKITGLAEKTVFVPAANVEIKAPEGFQGSLTVTQVGVRLRGPANRINSVKAEHVTVIVDATNVNGDNDVVKYTVQMVEGFEAFGAIGPCLVNVVLRQA